MDRYANPAIRQLKDQQVRYAPKAVRIQQIEKTEDLLGKLDPDRSYSYPDLCEKITDYRGALYPDLVIEGKEALHDLRRLVEDLSDSVDLKPSEVSDEVLTVNEVSKRFHVSTKTVDRWREKGLASRKFLIGNRKRVGFLKSVVDEFVSKHAHEVQRGSQFSQLSTTQKLEIIKQARKLAHQGMGLSEVSRQISDTMKRSVETIRYTIKNHDRDYPEVAVYPNAKSPLDQSLRHEIYRKHQRDVSVQELASHYGRTKSSIHRIISETRAELILDHKLDYMDSEEFHQQNADEVILTDPPVNEAKQSSPKIPPGLPAYLASLYEVPLLNREQEGYYFRKMNYLKFKAAQLREELDPAHPKARLMTKIEELVRESVRVKNFLIRSNLRLVVSIAKKHFKPHHNFFEMVSDGNMSLIRAIEKFDYSKGNKFSTYASWAIMKNYARSIPAEMTQLDRYRTGSEELFGRSTDARTNPFQEELNQKKQHTAIQGILVHLDPRERDIITHRFGLTSGSEPETLEQVGNRFGVTKERIRQIESRALKKLRKIAVEEKLDVPGL